MAGANGTMTLVIGLAALRRLADPAGVVADAKGWTDALGVAAENDTDDREVLQAFLDREAVEPGFVTVERRLSDALVSVRQRVTTDRHVFVGATGEARAIAESGGWEYLAIEDAAEKAGWALVDDGENSE